MINELFFFFISRFSILQNSQILIVDFLLSLLFDFFSFAASLSSFANNTFYLLLVRFHLVDFIILDFLSTFNDILDYLIDSQQNLINAYGDKELLF